MYQLFLLKLMTQKFSYVYDTLSLSKKKKIILLRRAFNRNLYMQDGFFYIRYDTLFN